MAVSGVCDSWKSEVMQAGHCFNTTVVTTGTTTNAAFTVASLASTAGLAVGMAVSGTGIAAGSVIASIDSAAGLTLSKAATASNVGTSLTFTGDVFKLVLIKDTPTHTFDHTQTNVGVPGTGSPSTSNVGTDEVSGTGYTTGGFALTNVGPSLPGNPTTTATVSFSPNPSWTSATFSTTAAIIYNNSTRLGAAATPLNGRAVAVYDFGGTQQVSNGTLTLVMPTNDGSNAILRVS